MTRTISEGRASAEQGGTGGHSADGKLPTWDGIAGRLLLFSKGLAGLFLHKLDASDLLLKVHNGQARCYRGSLTTAEDHLLRYVRNARTMWVSVNTQNPLRSHRRMVQVGPRSILMNVLDAVCRRSKARLFTFPAGKKAISISTHQFPVLDSGISDQTSTTSNGVPWFVRRA